MDIVGFGHIQMDRSLYDFGVSCIWFRDWDMHV